MKSLILSLGCTALASLTLHAQRVPVGTRTITILQYDAARSSGSIGIVPNIAAQKKFFSVPPGGLPSSLPLDPQRFHGPFKKGSDFAQINAVLKGNVPSTGNITWNVSIYFGDYFAGVATSSQNIYKRYFSAGAMPGATPLPPPGEFSVKFTLTRVSYSSRFGGSIELWFEQSEDYGYELAEGNGKSFIWDTGLGTRLKLYCPLNSSTFNTPNLLIISTANQAVHVALESESTTRYLSMNGAWVIDPAQTRDMKNQFLRDISSNIAFGSGTGGKAQLIGLVYGFVHAQLADTFDSAAETMTSVLVTDNYIDVTTVNKKAYAQIYVKLHDLYVSTDPVGRDEASVALSGFLPLGNDRWVTARAGIDIGDNYGAGRDSPWVLVAVVSPEEFDHYKANGGIWVNAFICEHDPVADDFLHLDLRYNFGAVTGAQLRSTLQANPSDRRMDEQEAYASGPQASTSARFKIVAVLR